MSEIIRIKKKIEVEPKYFNSKLQEHILTKLKSVCEDCSQSYGYLLSIIQIVEMKNNMITPLSTVFNVEFEAKVIKPEIGKKFKGVVTMIFQYGIFIEVQDKLKILIPQNQMNGYTYDKVGACFRNIKQKTTIEKDDEVTVVITNVRYEQRNFSCIGKLE